MRETAVEVPRRGPASTSGLYVEVLRDVASLERIRPQWHELRRASHEGSAFTGPTFALDWYRSAEPRGGIYVIAVWRGEVLAGVMPLSSTRVGGVRVLTSMGADGSYYGDPLLGPDQGAVAGAIVSHLCRITAWGLSVLSLRKLLAAGSVLKSLRDQSELDVRTLRTHTQCLLRFDQLGDVDEYFRQVSRRHQVERRRRRLAEHLGAVEYLPEDPEPDRAAAVMIDILKRRFDPENSVAGAKYLTKAEQFLTSSLFRELIDVGEAQISSLKAGGKRVAVSVDIAARNRLDAEYVANDPDYLRHGAGSVKMYEFLLNASRSGVEVVDLGSADYEYKSRWVPHTDELQDVLVTSRGASGALAHALRRVAMAYRKRRGVGMHLARSHPPGEMAES